MSADPSPLVSVIIPTYNRADWLCQAVESVLAQTWTHLEVIIVDDGSTDGSPEVLAARFPQPIQAGKLTLLRQPGPGRGVSAARNAGFRASQGELVAFLDDDDLYLPRKIERQADLLLRSPRSGLVHCRYFTAGADGKPITRLGPLPDGNVLPVLAQRNFIWMGAPLLRRSWLERVGLFDESLSPAADYDLWVRLALQGARFECVQEPLGIYRQTAGSMVTGTGRAESEVEAILARLFAHPGLGSEVAGLQNSALAEWRTWFSRRYYAEAGWEDAKRTLASALGLDPSLRADPQRLTGYFSSEAFDPRLPDPLAYIRGVLEHLPGEAGFLKDEAGSLLGQTHLSLALRAWSRRDSPPARAALLAALDSFPGFLAQPQRFAAALSAHAMSLPDGPGDLLQRVYADLPPEAASLRRTRRQAQAALDVSLGFEAHACGDFAKARGWMLRALLGDPSWAKNRGVLSVLLRGGRLKQKWS